MPEKQRKKEFCTVLFQDRKIPALCRTMKRKGLKMYIW